MPAGGGAYKLLLRVKQTDHSVVIAKDTTDEAAATAITSPAESDAALLLKDNASIDQIVETSGIKYDDSGVMTVSYGQTNATQAFWDFLEVAAPKKNSSSTATRTEKTSEAGVKIGGTSGAGLPTYLLIDKGPANATGDCLTTMAIVTVKKTSGSRDYKNAEFTAPTFEVVSQPCNKAGGFAIPQSAFSATHWGTISAGLRTIAKDAYDKTAVLPHP